MARRTSPGRVQFKLVPAHVRDALVEDFEKGRAVDTRPHPWQTDTCLVGTWHYERGCHYRSAESVIHELVHIVSKNGNMLLNVPLPPGLHRPGRRRHAGADLVGPNNAGKTNLCNALRFLSATTSLGLDESAGMVLGENWNITNAYFPDLKMEFEAEMTLSESGADYNYRYALKLSAEREALTGKQMLRVLDESLFITGGGMDHVALIRSDAGSAQIFDEKSKANTQTQVPSESTALSKLFDPELNKRAVLFKQQLGNVWYFNVNPSAAPISKGCWENRRRSERG